MSNTTLEVLQKNPTIIEIKQIFVNDLLREKLGPELSILAENNSDSIDVYRMVYLSQGHKVIGYIVEPKEGNLLPCIVYNRGGSKDFGSIKIGNLFLNLSRFAFDGYITIMSQYSGNAGGEGVDEMGGSDINDVEALYEILKTHPRADLSKIGMWGGSRGGMMTYLMLTKVSWIKAAVVVAGSSNLVGEGDFRPEMKEHYVKMFGGSEEEKKKRSAVYWVDKFSKNTPVLLMHGTSDWRVNPLDSINMSEQLYKNKIPHRLVMFEGGDHRLSEFKNEVDNMTIEWFRRFVKVGESLPNLEPHGV